MNKERVWFITGCSTGLGRALVEQVLLAGEKVVATARDPKSLKNFQEEYADQTLVCGLDVTQPDQIREAVDAAKHRFGRIDVLVNNAGYGIVGVAEDVPDAEVRELFEVNFFGALSVMREVLPVMRHQKSGVVFNMSSAAGFMATPAFGYYNATKFALEGLSEAMAQELKPLGIRMVIVEPGPFRTDFSGRSLRRFKQLDDYSEISSGVQGRMEAIHGKQPGDPVRAAQVMIQLVDSPNAPLRLPLGRFAIDRLRLKLTAVERDIVAWEKVTLDTDFPK